MPEQRNWKLPRRSPFGPPFFPTSILPAAVVIFPAQDQFHLSGWPEPGVEEGAFLLFADPFTVPIQDILGSWKNAILDQSSIGGLAGGGQEAGMNRLVLNDQVLDSGLVGVHLSGAVDIRPIISQGCR